MKIKRFRFLILSDLQIPFHNEAIVKNVIRLARRERFDKVLCVGDEMDYQTISRWSEKTPLAYEQTLHRDRELGREILWDLTGNSSEAHIVRSNHSDRLYNTLLKVPGLIKLPELQHEKFMGYDELGITFHKKPYEFLKGWYLAHGDEGSINRNAGMTALNLAKKWGVKGVISGHTHRLGLIGHSQGLEGRFKTLWGFEVGNMMDARKATYLRALSAGWQGGIGIIEGRGNNVTCIPIPINQDGSFYALGRHYS